MKACPSRLPPALLSIAALLPITALLVAGTFASIALAGDDCTVPMAQWQPRENVTALAASMGWDVRRIKIDDGCFEVIGRNKNGRRIEVKLNPATLAVIEFEYRDENHERSENQSDTYSDDDDRDEHSEHGSDTDG